MIVEEKKNWLSGVSMTFPDDPNHARAIKVEVLC
jgi:hypothetical protein